MRGLRARCGRGRQGERLHLAAAETEVVHACRRMAAACSIELIGVGEGGGTGKGEGRLGSTLWVSVRASSGRG